MHDLCYRARLETHVEDVGNVHAAAKLIANLNKTSRLSSSHSHVNVRHFSKEYQERRTINRQVPNRVCVRSGQVGKKSNTGKVMAKHLKNKIIFNKDECYFLEDNVTYEKVAKYEDKGTYYCNFVANQVI